MRHVPRKSRAGVHRAVAGSVAIHLVLALVLALAVRSGSEANPARPGIDTRAAEATLRLAPDEVTIPAAVPEPTHPTPAPPREAPPTPAEKQPASRPGLARTPHVVPLTTLPAEVLAVVRRTDSSTLTDANVKAAVGLLPSPTTLPLHGAMKPGQKIVYVLDCSGSMGEYGKWEAARATLLATLRRQPGTVKFQIVAYNTTARLLLPGGCMPVSAANLTAAEAELAKLTAAGRSNHAEAVRAAVALGPDAIVLLTDATELTAATFRAVIAAKPVPVCLARVGEAGVGIPRELR